MRARAVSHQNLPQSCRYYLGQRHAGAILNVSRFGSTGVAELLPAGGRGSDSSISHGHLPVSAVSLAYRPDICERSQMKCFSVGWISRPCGKRPVENTFGNMEGDWTNLLSHSEQMNEILSCQLVTAPGFLLVGEEKLGACHQRAVTAPSV